MTLSIKVENLTISKEFSETELHEATVEEVLIGAYDVISRIYTQAAVVEAYYKTDPDCMGFREPDDKVLQMFEKYGLLAGKQKE